MLGIPFPKKYGGQGGDILAYIMLVEELSKACGTTGVVLSAHTSLCCGPIYEFGTEEQKQKYLEPLAKGEKLGAFGLTEANAGTDAAGQQTKAVSDGDHYILNGSKIFITNAANADVFIVLAMTDKSKGTRGISAFIVEKEYEGFTIGKKELNQAIDLPDDLYDDHINEAEKKIDISLSLNSIFMVINFIFLGMSFEPRVAQIYVFLGLFLFNILVISLYEISTIRFIQQNDERLKGDPVSFRFRKDFFNSCDEAEKQKILKTSYHGFNLARNVSFALLIMTILSHMILETGIYAIFISGFMLLAIMGGYSYYAIFK